MKKQAYLILAHGSAEIFYQLISMIDFEGNDIFVHIDLKTDITNFLDAEEGLLKSNIYFLKNRQNIKWGDYSIVKAEIELLKYASSINDYSYFHLISGADFLLKRPEVIHNFFNDCKSKEFIQYWKLDIQNKELFQNRYRYFDLFIPKGRSKIIRIFYHIFRSLSIKIQKKIKIDRGFKEKYKIGSQWFSITIDFTKYIIENEKMIETMYKNTLCPDESFIQTLAFYSKFYNNIYMNEEINNYSSIKREIVFEKGKPKTWGNTDIEYLLKSSNFFARKFSDIDTVKILKKRLIEDRY